MKGVVEHSLDIYGTHLYLVTRRKAWARLHRIVDTLDAEAPSDAGQTHTLTWEPHKPGLIEQHVVVWINVRTHAGNDPHELVDTIAHEATHVATAILDHIGERNVGDEQRAYLTGWLTGWVWRNLDEAGRG